MNRRNWLKTICAGAVALVWPFKQDRVTFGGVPIAWEPSLPGPVATPVGALYVLTGQSQGYCHEIVVYDCVNGEIKALYQGIPPRATFKDGVSEAWTQRPGSHSHYTRFVWTNAECRVRPDVAADGRPSLEIDWYWIGEPRNLVDYRDSCP